MEIIPKKEAEKTYQGDYEELFEDAQKSLKEMGASIKEADSSKGTIKAVKKFQLIKKAKFTVKMSEADEGVKVSMQSSMSAWTMGAIDIGKNKKFIKKFFEALDNR